MKVRYMTKDELRQMYWDENAKVACLEHEDGTVVFPSRDEEGNGPGVLFGKYPNSYSFHVTPQGE